MDRRRVAIVLNPAAGRGSGAALRPNIEQLLSEAGNLEATVFETRERGHGSELASSAIAQGFDVVVAAGGDGTFSEVVQAAAVSGVPVALIPLGTGNDFSRHVGIHGDLRRAVRIVSESEPIEVDLGQVHGRWFVNVAGFGFDAEVALRVNQGYRWLRGSGAYLAALVTTFARYQAFHAELQLDDRPMEARLMLGAVANASMYGGGMKIAPNASINDGLLDVCLIRDVGRFEFLRAVPSVFRGAHESHPKVVAARARRISVETDRPVPVLADGEVVGATPCQFTLHPKALRMLLP